MDRDKPYMKRNFSAIPLAGYQILIFLAQIFILIACIEYMQIVYNHNILPDKLVKENYPQTSCMIMDKRLSEKGHLVHRYRADFLVSYSVNNKPYQAWVTGNGLDQAFFHEREPQEEALAQFDVKNSYPCWYNPQIPQIAVLVLRHDWASTLPLAVPSIIGLVCVYYILVSILKFIGLLSSRTRDVFKGKNQYRR